MVTFTQWLDALRATWRLHEYPHIAIDYSGLNHAPWQVYEVDGYGRDVPDVGEDWKRSLTNEEAHALLNMASIFVQTYKGDKLQPANIQPQIDQSDLWHVGIMDIASELWGEWSDA